MRLSHLQLSVLGFLHYQNYPEAGIRAADLDVDPKISVKNISIEESREIVDTGIAVQPGDVIEISADGEYRPGTGRTYSYKGGGTEKPSPDHAFQNADP